ncbi:MAG: hypothetical protein OXL36_05055 [Bryobacterales bacterium]|nr:hypothetical protein [Bryobacterales bacterium]MDE0295979.1 hypothetical protein [Bryobacterales bacterium]
MSAELIGILSVGVALVGLVLALGCLVFNLQSRTDKRLDEFGSELRRLSDRLSRLEGRVSRIEGLIEGLLFQERKAPEPAGD